LLLVDDGSVDATWAICRELFEAEAPDVACLRHARNRGHQDAVMTGMMFAEAHAAAALSIDADLQDDPEAIDDMVEAWRGGTKIVCGVRASRASDSFFKRTTARGFYVLVKLGGAKVIFDHADFRLMDPQAIRELRRFGTEDLFLRGLVTRLGLPIGIVRYDRRARPAGESKYSLKKMLHLARRGFESGRMQPADAPQIGELYIGETILQ
jgi:glycosyltransferase involved in cell wall biosynthesis